MVEANDVFGPQDAPSSPHKGLAFEQLVKEHFATKESEPVQLDRRFKLPVGFTKLKDRIFDLGLEDPPMLIECKASSWTRSDYVPSGKLHAWNEAMLYFSLAPSKYRKVLCVKRAYSKKKKQTLGEYYVKTYGHLIPPDVAVIEIDGRSAKVLHTTPMD